MAQAGLQFWMTRDDASDPCFVGTRDDRAKANNCTHFLSLHCNANLNPLATGTETIYRQSRGFAALVQECGLYAIERRDRGVKTEAEIKKTLAVLAFPQSALLEIGFITNSTDRARMLDVQRRIDFADALVRVLKKLP
jgi:N-acetylmuramoyl-L-alanine amidase